MTGDITSVPATNATLTLLRAGISPAQVLTMLQSAENLIPEGETANAEVLTLKQVNQNFQLLLRLVLANGSLTNLPVTSSVPFTPGSLLQVAQASANELTLTLQQLNGALKNSMTSIDTQQLPVGTLLQGKVMTSQVIAQAVNQLATQNPAAATPIYRSIVMLLNTALAGSSLTIESPQPLTVGSLLSAQVQGNQALNFVALPGRFDQLAVAQQLSAQQNRQGSLDTLINALQNLQSGSPTSTSPAISAPLQASINQLLADLPDVEQMTTPKGVAQALNASGVFLEARLLAGLNPAQQLPDMKANLMRLIAQILPGLPDNMSYGAAAASNTLARTMPNAIRNALGTLGLVAARTQPSIFPLPSRTVSGGEKEDDLEILLKLAAAAVSRLQSHQLGGLEQTRTNADGTQVTTWQLEVPMRNAHDIVPLQVKVQREDTPDQDAAEDRDGIEIKDTREKLWKVDLAFDLEPLGPLQVHAQLLRGTLSSQLWAERPDSAALIEHELGYLRERLIACGLAVGELACSHGAPPSGPRTALEQRWIDENA
ncbi:flagellar hook-length control protein FliK [Pseudomonas syringae]|uniref:Type III secretion system-associated protein with FliK-like domain n=1 Tax=Pseudomonas syringae pv. lapsa TaxID=199201 RepID=A0AB74A987_PSESX|nr:flagellar hook-length control protein FliK [Pseudomonas syringae]ALU61413.1 flagellar hook-length control protein FliK [Pseudomonas syringae pv. lapsa]KPX60338.1 putative type III secretion system-associated protein with FliK-like domain [Pseudomonas syringae pv. lapsa]MCF5735534.1 flagellar hook-length control protein FliK [Pseudomonas syringae]MCF5742702.1 flagellar hook-length control protein FliK [Pseudomonas syringae]MCF5748492.1 flagellar hook-length control protein FliK [Pseudomonas 